MSNSSVCGRNGAEFTFFIFTTNVYEIMSAVLRSPISIRFENTFLCAKKVSFFARSLRNIRKALHKYLQEWHCWSTSINGAESFAAFLLLPRHVVHANASCGLKNKSIKTNYATVTRVRFRFHKFMTRWPLIRSRFKSKNTIDRRC